MFSFFFNDTATTEIYTLSLHDALPIYPEPGGHRVPSLRRRRRIARPALDRVPVSQLPGDQRVRLGDEDRKSTRLNSSHSQISYAVFCLKKTKDITVQ